MGKIVCDRQMLCRAGPGDAIFLTFWRILIGQIFVLKKLRKFVWQVRWCVCLAVRAGSVCVVRAVFFVVVHTFV